MDFSAYPVLNQAVALLHVRIEGVFRFTNSVCSELWYHSGLASGALILKIVILARKIHAFAGSVELGCGYVRPRG